MHRAYGTPWPWNGKFVSTERRGVFRRIPLGKEQQEQGMSATGTRSNSQQMRDNREGRAGMGRVKYFEEKMTHGSNSTDDKKTRMNALEYYIKDINTDVDEMLKDASPEEKTMAKQKFMAMANSIV